MSSVPMLRDADNFAIAQRMASAFSKSTLIPEHFRDQQADCLVAMHMAEQMQESPLMVMQNLFFVGGRPGWITAFMIARANRSGKFRTPIRWKTDGAGDSLSVTCYADLAGLQGDDARVEATVSMAMAKADGWTMRWDKKLNKKVPAEKYVSMPEHMLKWRSAAFLIRLYAPETMMGIRTVEEIEDSISEMRDITPPRPTIDDFKPGATMATETPESVDSPSDVLATAQKVADQGWEALRLWWRTLSENNRDILQANVDDLIACARAVDAQRATESVGSGTSSEGGGADTDDEGTSTDVQPPSETNPAPAPEPRPARPPRVTPTRAQAGARTPPQEVVREQLQASVAATEPPTSEEALASGKYFSRERALAADEPFALTAPQQVQRSAEFTRLTEYMQMETTRAGLEQWRAMNERDISGLRGYEDRDFWQDYQERLERMP